MQKITWKDFEKIEIRVGTIVNVKDFPKAKMPAYKLLINFGDNIGIKHSSAQITDLYQKEDLIGKQVICVMNFPSKQIADFDSEVLTTGFAKENGEVILAVSDVEVPNGLRLK
ncbi:tRNA-binding protein [Candidatus Parcubacteria bacterium]|nr:tRNA-binding protein [Candidatus Parcubacteria bacterium]